MDRLTIDDYALITMAYLELAEEEWDNLFELVEGGNYFREQFLDLLNDFNKQITRNIKNAGGDIEITHILVENLVSSIQASREVTYSRLKAELVPIMPYNKIETAIRYLLTCMYTYCANRHLKDLFNRKNTKVQQMSELLREFLPKINLETFKGNLEFVIDEYIHDLTHKALLENVKKVQCDRG